MTPTTTTTHTFIDYGNTQTPSNNTNSRSSSAGGSAAKRAFRHDDDIVAGSGQPSLFLAASNLDELFDEQGVFREKFACKPREKNGPKNFIIRGLEFSPDSTQLAVAQSDNVVFVSVPLRLLFCPGMSNDRLVWCGGSGTV